jgi:hypothetical protein
LQLGQARWHATSRQRRQVMVRQHGRRSAGNRSSWHVTQASRSFISAKRSSWWSSGMLAKAEDDGNNLRLSRLEATVSPACCTTHASSARSTCACSTRWLGGRKSTAAASPPRQRSAGCHQDSDPLNNLRILLLLPRRHARCAAECLHRQSAGCGAATLAARCPRRREGLGGTAQATRTHRDRRGQGETCDSHWTACSRLVKQFCSLDCTIVRSSVRRVRVTVSATVLDVSATLCPRHSSSTASRCCSPF